MERRVNFLIIGAVFFLILIACVSFVIVMGRFSFDDSQYNHFQVYTQSDISGLAVNTTIRYKGIVIGNITHIGFDHQNPGVVKISTRIKKVVPVYEGAVLVMTSQGLAGGSFLSLKQDTKLPLMKEGGKLGFEPSLFGRIGSRADEASVEILELIKNLRYIFNEGNLNSTVQIFDQIQTLSKDLDVLVKNLNNQISSGEYNIRETLMPITLRLNTSLNQMDQFFKNATNVLDRFQKDPYNTLFGEQKK